MDAFLQLKIEETFFKQISRPTIELIIALYVDFEQVCILALAVFVAITVVLILRLRLDVQTSIYIYPEATGLAEFARIEC